MRGRAACAEANVGVVGRVLRTDVDYTSQDQLLSPLNVGHDGCVGWFFFSGRKREEKRVGAEVLRPRVPVEKYANQPT